MAISLPVKASFEVQRDSPQQLDTSLVSSRSTVAFRSHAFSRSFRLTARCAKVSIYECSDLTVSIEGSVLGGVVEVFKCRDVRLNVQGSSENKLVHIVQLDARAENVTIHFEDDAAACQVIVSQPDNLPMSNVVLSSPSSSIAIDALEGGIQQVIYVLENRTWLIKPLEREQASGRQYPVLP